MVHPSFAPRVHVWAVLRMLRHVYNLKRVGGHGAVHWRCVCMSAVAVLERQRTLRAAAASAARHCVCGYKASQRLMLVCLLLFVPGLLGPCLRDAAAPGGSHSSVGACCSERHSFSAPEVLCQPSCLSCLLTASWLSLRACLPTCLLASPAEACASAVRISLCSAAACCRLVLIVLTLRVCAVCRATCLVCLFARRWPANPPLRRSLHPSRCSV
jgi:hypothetical protein